MKDVLKSFADVDNFVRRHGNDGVLSAWQLLTDNCLLKTKETLANLERNEALLDAAALLPGSLRPHTKARYLLAHINDFELLKLGRAEYDELTALEKCLLRAFRTGSQIPKSDTGIYNILIEKY